jgi:hypothetical protein
MRVRTAWTVVFLLLGLASGTAADTQVVVGAKIGYANTDLVGSNDDGISTKNAAVLGGIFGWLINPWFALHVEPVFTQKGAEIDNFQFGDLPASVRLTYLELPVLAKFKYERPADTRSGPFGTIGPVFGFNTSDELEVAGSTQNVNQPVKSFDFGLGVGAGWDIAAGNGHATLEVRYVIGLTNVFDSGGPRPDITDDLKNRALQVSIGWFKRVH